jgi:hypothetical protein
VGQHVGLGVVQDRGGLGELALQDADDLVQLGSACRGGGLSKDRAHGGGDHVFGRGWDSAQDVAHQMDFADSQGQPLMFVDAASDLEASAPRKATLAGDRRVRWLTGQAIAARRSGS